MRQQVSSGAKWESIVGYCRAVRVDNVIHVAGTTAVDENGEVVNVGSAYGQAQHIFQIIGRALEELGASFAHVTRTRLFVVNIDDWEAVGRAHGEVFSDIRPASTLVAVSRLIHPDMLVEIEVDAVLNKEVT